jgi:cyclopropane-fatty-acyl-phospholipid synthase
MRIDGSRGTARQYARGSTHGQTFWGLWPSGRRASLLAVSAQEETPMNLAAQTEPRIDTGTPPAAPAVRPGDGSWRATVERALAERLLAWAGAPPLALVLPSGQEVTSGSTPAVARMRVADAGTLLGLLGPSAELHFGDAYADGRIEIDGDLQQMLDAVFRTQRGDGLARLGRWWRWMLRRGNSLRRARANAHHHYDLGNDFYALWLDREMVYTCAYFPTADATLEEAQVAKMEHVARKLRLRPGETVVEAGCGWGSLAIHLARQHGVRVRACNVSTEQIAWARDRARQEGLTGQVEFIVDDYRNLTGRHDAFVSVGMLEHVGREHYDDLCRVIDRTLSPEGRGLLHSIGRNRPSEFGPFVSRRIFPGAYPPALREMVGLLEPADLSVLDVENLRLHYARTLEHWLARFEAQRQTVAARFGERFVRMWRLYLIGSISGFRTGTLQLFQVLFARARSNAMPWTRDDLYRPPAPS